MSAYYKYGTATTTGQWPDDIAKKPMTGIKEDPECHRTLKKGVLQNMRDENKPFGKWD